MKPLCENGVESSENKTPKGKVELFLANLNMLSFKMGLDNQRFELEGEEKQGRSP